MGFEKKNFIAALLLLLASQAVIASSHSNTGENPFEEYRTAQMYPKRTINPNIAVKDKDAEIKPEEEKAFDTLDRLHNLAEGGPNNITEQDLQDLRNFLESPAAEELLDENYLSAMREKVNATLATVALTRDKDSLPINFGNNSDDSSPLSSLLTKSQVAEEVVSPLNKLLNKNLNSAPTKSLAYNLATVPLNPTSSSAKTGESATTPSLVGNAIESITNLPANTYVKNNSDGYNPSPRVGLKSLEEDYFKSAPSENSANVGALNTASISSDRISRPLASVSLVPSTTLNPVIGAVSETRPNDFFNFSSGDSATRSQSPEEIPLNDLASRTEEIEMSIENTQIEKPAEKISFVDSVKSWLDGFSQKNEEKEVVKVENVKVLKKVSKTFEEPKLNKGSDLSQLIDSIEAL